MKLDNQILKNTLINLIHVLMSNESYDEFIKQKYAVSAIFEDKYKADDDIAAYKQVMASLNGIKHQNVLNKVADKNEELLLQLNEDGSSTGKYIHRKEAHDKKDLKWHREVFAIVLRENGTFAVIKRSTAKKSYGGAIGGICGHVEGIASCHEAVVTECGEELGTLFAQEKFVRLTDALKNPREDNLAYTSAYVVASNLKQGIFLYQEQEVDGVEWISVDQLEQYINLSKIPEFSNMCIFKDTEFYRGIVSALRKLFTLDNWYDCLSNADYKSIHKHLGLKTPYNEEVFYQTRKLVPESANM